MATATESAPKKGWLDRVEKLGNALPDPVTLFFLGAVMVFLVSWIASNQGWRTIMLDADGKEILNESAKNLLSKEGFRWLSLNLVDIFVGFRPLGLVLAVAIGIGVAEKSGFITAALKSVLVYVPRGLLTPATFFTGVMSSMALDAGYIVLPPLAAAIYKAVGRSPLVGIAAVVAGVASVHHESGSNVVDHDDGSGGASRPDLRGRGDVQLVVHDGLDRLADPCRLGGHGVLG